MTANPIPNELVAWAQSALRMATSAKAPAISAVAGDASSRRYFRMEADGASYILVNAPAAREDNQAFVRARELLVGMGVRVPALHASNLELGYLLLEDLGDRLLLDVLDARTANDHYRDALAVLQRLAARAPATVELPLYSRALLEEELARFPIWFVEALLGYSPGAADRELLARLGSKLIDSALEQPQVLVHRDFHSRNLMLPGDGELAVIDFQDAVVGPISYDPVSLLRDCYIRWPQHQVDDWARSHRDKLHASGLLSEEDAGRFLRWFDWMGLQRHLKVLGTFARLYLRDGKPAYLQDLPLVNAYVLEILEKYAADEPVFAAVSGWYERKLSALIAGQAWSASQ